MYIGGAPESDRDAGNAGCRNCQAHRRPRGPSTGKRSDVNARSVFTSLPAINSTRGSSHTMRLRGVRQKRQLRPGRILGESSEDLRGLTTRGSNLRLNSAPYVSRTDRIVVHLAGYAGYVGRIEGLRRQDFAACTNFRRATRLISRI